jgi:hypothetical protein
VSECCESSIAELKYLDYVCSACVIAMIDHTAYWSNDDSKD